LNYRIAVVDVGTYSTRLLISAVHKKDSLKETLNSIEDILSMPHRHVEKQKTGMSFLKK